MTQTYDLTDDDNAHKFRAFSQDVSELATDALELIDAIRNGETDALELSEYDHFEYVGEDGEDGSAEELLALRLNQLSTACNKCIGRHSYQGNKLNVARKNVGDDMGRVAELAELGIFGELPETDGEGSETSDLVSKAVAEERQTLRAEKMENSRIL